MKNWISDFVSSWRMDSGKPCPPTRFRKKWSALEKQLKQEKDLPETNVELCPSIMRRVRQSTRSAPDRSPSTSLPKLAWAASAVALLAIAGVLLLDFPRSPHPLAFGTAPSLEEASLLQLSSRVVSPLSGELELVQQDVQKAAAYIFEVFPDLPPLQ